MKSARRFFAWVVIAVGLVGCATGRWDGSIPVGEWEGTGYYVYSGEERDDSSATSQPAASQPARDRTKGRKATRIRGSGYRTSLSIRPMGDGRDAVELRVRSEHTGEEDWGKDVLNYLELERIEQVSDTCVIYRVVRADLDEERIEGEFDLSTYPESQPSEIGASEIQILASVMRSGEETEVILLHPQGWGYLLEVLRFRGDEVIKSGSLALGNSTDDNVQFYWWREELRKK